MQEAARKAIMEGLSGSFNGKDILADNDGGSGAGGSSGGRGRGGGGGGGWNEWFGSGDGKKFNPRQFIMGILAWATQTFGALGKTLGAIMGIGFVIWILGNFRKATSTISNFFAKMLRLDGGSRMQKLKEKEAAARRAAAQAQQQPDGDNSLGAMGSSVTAKWGQDDDEDDDDDASDDE